jgi:hypothetical protein
MHHPVEVTVAGPLVELIGVLKVVLEVDLDRAARVADVEQVGLQPEADRCDVDRPGIEREGQPVLAGAGRQDA